MPDEDVIVSGSRPDDDMRAVLIYQRATQEAADRIADGITDQAERLRAARDSDGHGGGEGPAGSRTSTG